MTEEPVGLPSMGSHGVGTQLTCLSSRHMVSGPEFGNCQLLICATRGAALSEDCWSSTEVA